MVFTDKINVLEFPVSKRMFKGYGLLDGCCDRRVCVLPYSCGPLYD